MKTVKNIIILIIVLLVAFAGLVIANGYSKYLEALKQLPLEEMTEQVESKENFCPISEIPQMYIKAVIAVEDRRFYQHSGIDVIGIARAVITDIKTMSLSEGGSTISQQLAKNLYFPQDNTPDRKIAEMFMASRLEKEFSKEKILELYFNCIYYGSGYYCIYDAAMGYFNKKPVDMNGYESTLLAGIPNAPSVYSPKVNPELSHERQEKVLSSMIDCGYIDQAQKESIVQQRENYNW